MRRHPGRVAALTCLLLLAAPHTQARQANPAPQPHTVLAHDVALTIEPAAHRLSGRDTLTLAPGGAGGPFTLLLHQGLAIDGAEAAGRPVSYERGGTWEGLSAWLLELPAGAGEVTVHYGGTVFEPPRRGPRAGLATETEGIISPEGLFLPQAAALYPWQPHGRPKLKLAVDTPEGYEAVSGGRLASRQTAGGRTRVVWEDERPADSGGCLFGGPLVLHEEKAAGVPLYLYFYPEDADLVPAYAAKIKEALPYYTGLFGEFPYAKFAVVENFFPTGYGFPSLTLLGRQVVRLPFVLEGSLVHELCHSWWGGSVDARGGNWVEGLTAYLADYLLVERQGPEQAAAERRRMLERYSAYAPRLSEPLSAFREPGERLQDVLGYTKGALVFHGLRREVGDGAFFGGLRLAASRFKGASASWADLEGCFEQASGCKLDWFFAQWVERPGQPTLRLAAHVVRAGQEWRTVATLKQGAGRGPLWLLRVPLVLECEGGGRLVQVVTLSGRQATVEFTSAAAPRRLVADPGAEVLRLLGEDELPLTLHRFFAAKEKVYALPRGPLAGAARRAAEALSAAEPGRIMEAAAPGKARLKGEAVMYLGEPPEALAEKIPGAPRPSGEGFVFRGRTYPKEAAALLVCADPTRGGLLALLYSRGAEGLESAARLVPHLGRYQWAVFQPGQRPVKGDPEPAAWLSVELAPGAAP